MTSKKVPAFNDWPNDIGFTTQEEQSKPVDLEVIGAIPAYASTAAAKKIHTLRLASSGILTHVWLSGNLSGITFGQKHDPYDSLYAKFKSCFFGANSGFTTAAKNDDEEIRSLAKTDATIIQLLDVRTLKPGKYLLQKDLHPDLRGPLAPHTPAPIHS
ncbi:hypothetical protein B9Z19DRAFT_1126913 [Tuber borchii]|uniref:Uncharacterized protein n=1 Tax=Tuber borchii TaxID=42251 RepID=A0A2T6ZS88_TUBBO|nr:hypothetical protein B9Z19DRAFT_1126913 [Tuber borchii]